MPRIRLSAKQLNDAIAQEEKQVPYFIHVPDVHEHALRRNGEESKRFFRACSNPHVLELIRLLRLRKRRERYEPETLVPVAPHPY